MCMVFFLLEERQVLNKYGIYLYKSCAQAAENDNQKEKRKERKSINLIKEGKYVCRHGKNSE